MLIVLGSTLLLSAGTLRAQAWSGSGGDNLWTDGANWQGGAAPSNDGTADVVSRVQRG